MALVRPVLATPPAFDATKEYTFTFSVGSGGEITMEDLPPSISNSSGENNISIPVGVTLDEAEKTIIAQNLAANKGNKSKTAEVLGIERKTLHRKLEKYGIEADED